MKGKMQGVTLVADWDPKPGFKLGAKDIEGRQTYLGSQVWRNPRLEIREYDIPTPGPEEVLMEVKACGICGSDVHMAQADKDGYIFYPGLTGFPCILGHEFSGVVVEAGKNAFDKRTNKPFKGGEASPPKKCSGAGSASPAPMVNPTTANGWMKSASMSMAPTPNTSSCPPAPSGAWNRCARIIKEEDIFVAGSLVEPTCVAYNAVIERGGGIRPGDRVVILGGGPVGIAACAILKRAGASQVIISETQDRPGRDGLATGCDYHVNPLKEDFADRVLEITDGMGADMFMEATGLPEVVYPGIERVDLGRPHPEQHGGRHRPRGSQNAGHW